MGTRPGGTPGWWWWWCDDGWIKWLGACWIWDVGCEPGGNGPCQTPPAPGESTRPGWYPLGSTFDLQHKDNGCATELCKMTKTNRFRSLARRMEKESLILYSLAYASPRLWTGTIREQRMNLNKISSTCWTARTFVYHWNKIHSITVDIIVVLDFQCGNFNESTAENKWMTPILEKVLSVSAACTRLQALLISVSIAILLGCHFSVLSLTSPLYLLSFFIFYQSEKA